MTPSLPTFSIASAIRSPISLSLFAEMAPTWAISFLPCVGDAHLLELFDDRCDGLVDAALERHRVGAGGDVLEAFAEDRLGENGRGGGAVAGEVASLGRDFLHHLRAHVLERIGELDLLRDGDAVLGDGRCAELLVDDDVSALRSERDLHRLGELIDAALERRARVGVEMEFFGCHVMLCSSLAVSSTTASTSASRRIRSCSPSIVTSVPLYFPYRTLSPTLSSIGTRLSFS